MLLYCDIRAAFLLLYDQSKAVLFFSMIVKKHLELCTDAEQTGSVFQPREKVQNTFDFEPLFFRI